MTKSSNQVIITREKNLTRHQEVESKEGEGDIVRVKEKEKIEHFTALDAERMRRGKKIQRCALGKTVRVRHIHDFRESELELSEAERKRGKELDFKE